MKVKDLHIGDILMIASSPIRIDALDERNGTIRGRYLDVGKDTQFFKANIVAPMPIDKEMLESNFQVCGKVYMQRLVSVKFVFDGIANVTIHDNDGNVIVNTVVKYVHELQRALRCGGLSDKANVLRVQ